MGTPFPELFSAFETNQGASDAEIAAVESELKVRFPADYREFLKWSNGGEGFIGTEYLMVWPVQDLGTLNREYQVAIYDAGIFIIGSNGGGEALAFDRRESGCPFIRVPFVGMHPTLHITFSPNFRDWLEACAVCDDSPAGFRPEWYVERREREIFEITPVILGGNPTDPKNKALIDRKTHIQAVRHWNQIISDLRSKQHASS